MSELKLFRRTTIKDKFGKVKYDSGLVPSNSIVIAFLNHVYGSFDDTNRAIIDVTNASRTVVRPTGGNYRRNRVTSGDNNDDFGIVVGSGTAAESNTDYKLDTQIAHGTGAGQLDYSAHSFSAPAVVGDNVDMVFSRSFYNGSGSDVTVSEIGVYCESRDSGGVYRFFCIVRDVLGAAETIGDTLTYTVQYTLRTTV